MTPKMDPHNPKKSDLNPDTLYFICPDPSCEAFYDTSRNLACNHECPRNDNLIKFRYCELCDQIIENDDFGGGFRIEHKCKDGDTVSMMDADTFGLVYKRPE